MLICNWNTWDYMKMLILTFKDHSIKRKKKPIPCIQLPNGAPLAGRTTNRERGLYILLQNLGLTHLNAS